MVQSNPFGGRAESDIQQPRADPPRLSPNPTSYCVGAARPDNFGRT